jgi:surfeit locus 1 family protein
VTLAPDIATPGSGLTDHDDVASLARRPRLGLAFLVAVGVIVFSGLGVWQLERRVWKLDLLDRVERRVHAPPVSPPGPASWPRVNAKDDAYRHVMIKGRFLDVAPALALAVTEYGGGYWVMAPFRTDDGPVVLVNRGFLPLDYRSSLAAPPGEVIVIGLLRMSEPRGGFLRHNDPAADRWYSRDVASIARSRGLHAVAPYFIDADAAGTGSLELPIGGLTVIAFPNNHLMYALTWFALAAMLLGWSLRAGWRRP